jgi:hypothetical protein
VCLFTSRGNNKSTTQLLVPSEEIDMQHVGERKDPSIRNLVIIVVIAMALIMYAIISFATGDWLWFSSAFRETPTAVVLHCRGETISFDPGSFQFSKSQMIVIEFFYREPIRVHSSYKFFSSVDNLVIPLEGRHSQTNAVFGQNDGVPTGGSLHINSTDQFKEFLNNMDLCQVEVLSGN